MSTLARLWCALVAAVLITTVSGAGSASAGSVHGAVVGSLPSARTPHVLDNKVLDIEEVGSRIVVVGSFTKVRDASANGGATFAQRSVVAFDRATGAIDRSFRVVLDGQVNTVAAGPAGTVYLGGTFATVNGVTVRNLVQVDLATGARIAAFRVPAINGAVNALDLAGGRLFLGGYFNAVGGVRHGGLAAVDPATGAVDEYLGVDVSVNHNWPTGKARGAVGVKELDVSPDGSRLVAIGNFKIADGLPRDQVVVVLLRSADAVVDAGWRTRRLEPACNYNAFDSYVRDVEYSPDGSHFVVVSTGAYYRDTLCDAAASFATAARGDDVQPRWVNVTGGDTLLSVAVTDTAVYVGGHHRFLNNPLAVDAGGPGSVPRPGIGALDPRTGVPLTWNPGRNPRGIGAETLLATSSGLYVGMDTEYFGNWKHYRPRLGFFPLAEGTALPSENAGGLPAGVFLAGRTTSSPGTSLDDVRGRFFDGTRAGPDTVATTSGTAWSRARGAFRVGDTLFYGYPGSDGKYALFRRSFDGTRYGSPTRIDPYNDPYWSTISSGTFNGKNVLYRGRVPSFYGQLSSVTAMAYRDGRLYYTLSGYPRLYYRYFSVDSGVVSETAFVAAEAGFDATSGLILSGDALYVGSLSTGELRRRAFVDGKPGSTSTVVSGPARDGKDWRTRAMFLGPRPNEGPTAAIAAQCEELACAFDGRGSTDADGRVVSHRWDFGDGTSATGATPAKTYRSAGTFTVRLTVTDDEGASASTTQDVTVDQADEGTGITLRGSSGTSVRAVTSVSVAVPATVRAGDGLVLVLSTNSAVTGSPTAGWTAEGTQTAGTAVTTRVFSRVAGEQDAGSRVSVPLDGTAAATLQVLAYSGTDAADPVTSLTGAAGGAATSHTTPAATAPAGSTVLSVWSDKSPAARTWTPPPSVTERGNLAGAGSGDVATLVADAGPVAAGTVGNLTATVSAPSARATMLTVVLAPEGSTPAPVPNQAPVAELSTSCAGLVCTFDGTGSTDPDGTVRSYAWDLGDGATSTEGVTEHSYAQGGDYTVTLTVTDDDGLSVSETATITVDPAPVGSGIALRGSAGTAARPVTSVTVDVPAEVRAGDGLVLVLSTNSAVTGTAPAGWTLQGRQTDGTAMTTQVFSRVADAADAGSQVTVPLSGTAAVTLQLAAYAGTASSGPVASVTGAASGKGTEHTTPLVTAPAGSWLLSIWSDKSAESRQFVPPAEGLSPRSNLAGAGSGDIATLVADSGAPVAGGQVGGLTATVPTPSSRSTVLSVVLVPAS